MCSAASKSRQNIVQYKGLPFSKVIIIEYLFTGVVNFHLVVIYLNSQMLVGMDLFCYTCMCSRYFNP